MHCDLHSKTIGYWTMKICLFEVFAWGLLQCLGGLRRKHLPMRERALVAVKLWNVSSSSGFGTSRSFLTLRTQVYLFQMLAAEDGLFAGHLWIRKRGKRWSQPSHVRTPLEGMALSTVLLNNCSNEVLLLMNAVTTLGVCVGDIWFWKQSDMSFTYDYNVLATFLQELFIDMVWVFKSNLL